MVLALLLFGACVHRPVDVSIRAAVIGPADWDGAGGAAPVIRSSAISALARVDPLAGAVGEQVARGVLLSFAPPDVRGSAVVFLKGGGHGSSAVLPEVSDSFGPVWPAGSVVLRGVPLDKGTAVEVSLDDVDLFNGDDPIARVLVSRAQLLGALRAQKPVWLDFEAATGGALLKLAIEVAAPTAEASR